MDDVLISADQGPGTRRWAGALALLPVRQLRTSAVVLAIVATAVAVISRHPSPGIDGHQLAMVGASLAVALTGALAWLNLVIYRSVDDPRSLYISVAAASLAVFPLTFGTVVPSLVDSSPLDDMRAVFALAAVPALLGITMASRSLETAIARRPRRVVVAVIAGGLAVVAVGTVLRRPRAIEAQIGVPLPLAGPLTSSMVAAGFAAIVLVHLVAARRQSGQVLSWSALAAAGIGAAYALSAFSGEAAQPFAWLLVAVAAGIGLYGAAAELQRHHAVERQRAFAAVADAFEATARANAVRDDQTERRHEARSALLGIEAAAQGLARHRSLLTPEQFDALSAGLVAEVQRLRSLIEARPAEATTFDLREVVVPVISCLRADGVDVRSSIPPGVVVQGTAAHTAQVMVSLLTNAKRHAPGSPVELRAEIDAGTVVVYVDDRGPGVTGALQERVFERGVQAGPGEGDGLGLYISRQLMEQQHASIRLQDRPGGGSSFILRFPSASGAAA